MWKKINERLGYEGWRKIRIKQFELPNGKVAEFDIVSTASFATIAAFTEAQEAILIRQYRPGPERELLSFAEGAIDAGETPLLAAQRELLEETGYASEDWTFLKKRNSAYTDQHQYFFLARNCRWVQSPEPDGGEFLSLELMSLPQLKALLRDPQEDSFSNIDAAYLALDWMGG